MNPDELKFPDSMVTKHQFVKFLSEFEKIDSELTEREIRMSSGAEAGAEPERSNYVNQFLEANQLDLNNGDARSGARTALQALRKTVPVVHVTFAAEADPESLASVASWFRQNMHPHALIEVGLQPGLVAGAYVRSQNRVYDYSLRARIAGQRKVLVSALKEAK